YRELYSARQDLGGGAVLAYMCRRPKSVCLDRTQLTAPETMLGRKTVEIPYESISCLVEGHLLLGQRYFAIEYEDGHQRFRPSFFEDGEFDRFASALEARIRGTPDGRAVLERSRRQAERAERFRDSPMWAVTGIFATIAAVFALQMLFGTEGTSSVDDFDVMRLYELGGWWRPAVLEGQWDRVFTANVLHDGLIHFGMNAIGFVLIGSQLEKYIGPARITVVVLASALTGVVGVALVGVECVVMVGSSTAVFGLVGACTALFMNDGDDLVLHHRALRWWFFPVLVAVDLAVAALEPSVSFGAHLGGFVGGLAAGWLLIPSDRMLPPAPSTLLVRVVALALAACFAAGFARSAHRLATADPEKVREEWAKLAVEHGVPPDRESVRLPLLHTAYQATEHLGSSKRRR
ncbi:MAG: rhomboid family intramembrane serine protease, partial [Bradymonadaceae bacterium]